MKKTEKTREGNKNKNNRLKTFQTLHFFFFYDRCVGTHNSEVTMILISSFYSTLQYIINNLQ